MNEIIFTNGLTLTNSKLNIEEKNTILFFKDFKISKTKLDINIEDIISFVIANIDVKKKEDGYVFFIKRKYKDFIKRKIDIKLSRLVNEDIIMIFNKEPITMSDYNFFNENTIKEIMFILLKDYAVYKNNKIYIKGSKDFLKKLQVALLSFKIKSKRNKYGLHIEDNHSIMKCLIFDKKQELKRLKRLCRKVEDQYLLVGENTYSFSLVVKDYN